MMGAPGIMNPEDLHNRIGAQIGTLFAGYLGHTRALTQMNPYAALPVTLDLCATNLAMLDRELTAQLLEAMAAHIRAPQDAGTSKPAVTTIVGQLYARIAFAGQPVGGTA